MKSPRREAVQDELSYDFMETNSIYVGLANQNKRQNTETRGLEEFAGVVRHRQRHLPPIGWNAGSRCQRAAERRCALTRWCRVFATLTVKGAKANSIWARRLPGKFTEMICYIPTIHRTNPIGCMGLYTSH